MTMLGKNESYICTTIRIAHECYYQLGSTALQVKITRPCIQSNAEIATIVHCIISQGAMPQN